MAVNLSCSVPGDECSEPGGQIVKGMCLRHYHSAHRKANPKPQCLADGCESVSRSRGYCFVHRDQSGAVGACSFDGCTKLVAFAGLCHSHYTEKLEAVAPDCGADECSRPVSYNGLCKYHAELQRKAGLGPCSIPGCPNRSLYNGMCSAHYQRARRYDDPLGGGMMAGTVRAFIEKAVLYEGDDCLLWPFYCYPSGYGEVRYENQLWSAHRLILTLTEGEPPDGKPYACHLAVECHNRACVNPHHLRWDSHEENMADKLLDGTHNRGERHGNAKLTTQQVLAIRRDPRPDDVVALEYGVSKGHIQSIRARRSWAWLDEETEPPTP